MSQSLNPQRDISRLVKAAGASGPACDVLDSLLPLCSSGLSREAELHLWVSVDPHLHLSVSLREINFKALAHMIVGLARLKPTGLKCRES